MEKYSVTGMSCAACSSAVEKATGKVVGVKSCSVSLLTNSMTVEGEYSEDELFSAVQKAGYGISKFDRTNSSTNAKDTHENEIDKETASIKNRLLSSLVFLLVLMYVSMGHNMLSLPLPFGLANNPLAIGIVQLLLSAIVLVINQKFFINGFKSLFRRNPNMDTLVALGSSVSFLYSVYILFLMSDSALKGNDISHYLHEFYFESAAMILVLITVGKMLESRSKGKTTDALNKLMKLAPSTATVERDGKEMTVPVKEVQKNEIFVVRPGESIAFDGIVTEGHSSVNESALTGESLPVDKEIGSHVSSGTVNVSGFIKCRVTETGEDTTLAKIIKMVSDASATKAPAQRIADKVSGIFVPVVIAIALFTVAIWLILGEEIGFALVRGISVLVISCPCALGLATPVAIMVGNGVGAKNGILFKTAEALENTGKIKTVAFDKTGTITKGEPVLTDIYAFGDATQEELLRKAYSLEIKSEHPLAKAVSEYAENNGVQAYEISDFEVLPGNGLSGNLDGKVLCGGNMKYISSVAGVDDESKSLSEKMASEGKTPLFFAYDGKLIGVLGAADVIKEDSITAIDELNKMGIRTVMITGDNRVTAESIAKQVALDEIYASVLPDGKEKIVRELKEKGSVAMVGDGINDSPALTTANVGIAIGAGTDIAIDSADVVLMKSRLSDVARAIKISRATLRNIHQNLFWAFFYNVIGIPLAAGAFSTLLGWKMTPMFGALAMSLSSFCVVTNALRLNLLKLGNEDEREMIESAFPGQKTIYIKGMMCEHCEKRVKEILENIDGVVLATADHKKGIAIVTLKENNTVFDADGAEKALNEEDYKLKKIV
ncbi:MAG: heavy metal translocating P-type ATPase [Clostridia bacterium]|nr:heavy metal translocating P-type ATPase [Clostridia bacterium]